MSRGETPSALRPLTNCCNSTPPGTITKIRDGMARVLATPEIKSLYGNFGFEPGGLASADFARLIKSDHERWGKFIKAIGYTGEP